MTFCGFLARTANLKYGRCHWFDLWRRLRRETAYETAQTEQKQRTKLPSSDGNQMLPKPYCSQTQGLNASAGSPAYKIVGFENLLYAPRCTVVINAVKISGYISRRPESNRRNAQ